MTIPKFILQFSIFSVVVFLLPFGLERLFSITALSEYYVVLFLFLFFLTIIVYVVSYIGIQKGGQNSVLSILGGLTLKMVFSLSMILVLILKSAENQKVLAANFFYLYFLFTVFEVICLLRNLRDQNKT